MTMQAVLNATLEAKVNLTALADNPYPGRGIIAGLDETGKFLVQVYWIMGRSMDSRNRIFEMDGALVRTAIADPSLVRPDANLSSLIIYNAMREAGKFAIVSNGHQTDGIAAGLTNGDQNFHMSLRRYTYEPDAPNFTPRISACSWWTSDKRPVIQMSILRKSPWDTCDRHLYEFGGLGQGYGYCLTTYSSDGDPLPSFHGDPYLVPLLASDAELIGLQYYMGVLNRGNLVAVTVKFIPRDGGPSCVAICNKYGKKQV